MLPKENRPIIQVQHFTAGYDGSVVIDDISRLARGIEAHIQLRAEIGSTGASLESPSIEFGEDSDSQLVENMLSNPRVIDAARRARLYSPFLTLLLDLEFAILLGAMTSLGYFLYKTTHPHMAIMAPDAQSDGVRVQAHVTKERVTLFARGTGDVTASFPEVVAKLRALFVEPCVV